MIHRHPVWTVIAILAIVLYFVGAATGLYGLMFIAFAVFPGIPVARWAWKAGSAVGGEFRVASTPIPSPAQIELLLAQEWGRQPTLQEVAAVHQMLQSRRNQALMISGVGLGAIYLMGHHGV